MPIKSLKSLLFSKRSGKLYVLCCNRLVWLLPMLLDVECCCWWCSIWVSFLLAWRTTIATKWQPKNHAARLTIAIKVNNSMCSFFGGIKRHISLSLWYPSSFKHPINIITERKKVFAKCVGFGFTMSVNIKSPFTPSMVVVLFSLLSLSLFLSTFRKATDR